MNKIPTVVLLCALSLAGQAFAQSQNDEDIKSDVNAVDKDNAAAQKDQNTLAKNRAAKAADKANGDYGSQAVDSVKIGADQAAIGEKNTEKSVDKKVLQQHKKDATHDNGDTDTSTSADK